MRLRDEEYQPYNFSAMETNEIAKSIKIGLDKPKYYKRSVWNTAEKIMEVLLQKNTDIRRVYRTNGNEKYASNVPVTEEQLNIWAMQYKKAVGEKVYVSDCISALNRIAVDLHTKVNDGRVLTEFNNRY